jgi:hypothetical protein
LKVGGVLYISYNTLPGWAAFAPIRHLMTEHADILGAEGRGIVSRIDGAMEFAHTFLATNPLFLKANPLVGERLNKIKDQNRHYLAHEYFNKDWHPMHFATLRQWLAPAKVEFACSANMLDAIDAINLTAEQQAFLNEIPDPMFQQTVRDFMVNQQFRKDYWVKGPRRLSSYEQTQKLRNQRFVLTTAPADISLKITGALGEANLNEPVYKPILQALSSHTVCSLGDVEQQVASQDVSLAQLVQAVKVLMASGHAYPAQLQADSAKVAEQVSNLNAHLKEKAKGGGDLSYLASPITGGGVPVSRFGQLFLLAQESGKTTSQEWAAYAWQILAEQRQRILKDGKPLETPAENLQELETQALEFEQKAMPILRALQVAQ